MTRISDANSPIFWPAARSRPRNLSASNTSWTSSAKPSFLSAANARRRSVSRIRLEPANRFATDPDSHPCHSEDSAEGGRMLSDPLSHRSREVLMHNSHIPVFHSENLRGPQHVEGLVLHFPRRGPALLGPKLEGVAGDRRCFAQQRYFHGAKLHVELRLAVKIFPRPPRRAQLSRLRPQPADLKRRAAAPIQLPQALFRFCAKRIPVAPHALVDILCS